MATGRDQRPSEFGGVPGRIQPPPHDINGDASNQALREQARLMRATDSLDPADDVSGALAREWAEEGRA